MEESLRRKMPIGNFEYYESYGRKLFQYNHNEIRSGKEMTIGYRDIPMDINKIPRMYWVIFASDLGIPKIRCLKKKELKELVTPYLPKKIRSYNS